MSEKEVNVILVGAKSIGQYGGYESFINKLQTVTGLLLTEI